MTAMIVPHAPTPAQPVKAPVFELIEVEKVFQVRLPNSGLSRKMNRPGFTGG